MLILLDLDRPSPAAAHWQTRAYKLLGDMRVVALPLLLLLCSCNMGGHSATAQDNESVVARDAETLQKSTDQSVKTQVDSINAETPPSNTAASTNVPPSLQPGGAGAAQAK